MVLGSDLRDQCPSRRSGVFNVDMIAERGVHGDAALEQFDRLDDEFGLAVLPTGSAVFVPGHGPWECSRACGDRARFNGRPLEPHDTAPCVKT